MNYFNKIIKSTLLFNFFFFYFILSFSIPLPAQIKQINPVEKKILNFKSKVETRLKSILDSWPVDKSTQLTLVVYKQERILEVWMTSPLKKKLKTYPFTAFSGRLGPKNRQGDRQIPEGLYKVDRMNPFSQYYLSIGINYPNELDRQRGKEKNIKDLGGDIFIHGKNKTIGCIPIGDEAIEELFYLVNKAGYQTTKVVISPQRLPLPPLSHLGIDETDGFGQKKYTELKETLKDFL